MGEQGDGRDENEWVRQCHLEVCPTKALVLAAIGGISSGPSRHCGFLFVVQEPSLLSAGWKTEED